VILIQLKILFNLICVHGFVPDDFGIGIVVPVVKDRLGNMGVSDNYRSITFSPFVSKIFEYCVCYTSSKRYLSQTRYSSVLRKTQLLSCNYLCCHQLPIISLIIEVLST